MKVLSLFDGISAGQVALQRLGIKIDSYYASEIDKYAIQIAKKNFPNTIQLGDIKNWRDWDIDLSQIGILFGGFPCQNYSVAGKQTGTEGESGSLIYYLAEIFVECKRLNWDLIFLFENVKMKKEFLETVNDIIKAKPTLIDSALVSAQSRKRNYWTNLGEHLIQPEDKSIKLRDILESGESLKDLLPSLKINSTFYENGSHKTDGCIRVGGISNKQITPKKFGQGQRVHSIEGKSVTLSAQGGGQGAKTGLYKFDLPDGDYIVRKLTPLECERLQTFPEKYTEGCSNSQRYKMLGNSWTVDVIVHILKELFKQGENYE